MTIQHRIASRVARSWTRKEAFNKYNAPELLSQLITVLKKEDLDDAALAVKAVAREVNDAWRHRER